MYRKLHKIVTIVILMSMVITATAFAQDANPSGPVPVDGGVTAAGRPERLVLSITHRSAAVVASL